jgi:VWFA-related protein
MANKKISLLATAGALFLFFWGPYAFSQKAENEPGQQKNQEIPKPVYEVNVVVTNVDVVVTDSAGKRVTGLKPENFRLIEDGYPQKLTNFYEVKGLDVIIPGSDKESGQLRPAPSAPLKSSPIKTKIIFYFDNWQLHPLNRNQSIKRLEPFIRHNFPEDGPSQGMVVSLDQKLEIVQGFTSSASTLLQALDEVKKGSGQSLVRAKNREEQIRELNSLAGDPTNLSKNENYERAAGFARSFAEEEQNSLQYSLKSLSALVTYLTGIEGKKMLIYVSDGLPLNPGEEVFAFLDQAFATGSAQTEAMNYDATHLFKELTARCNSNEIVLYPINSRGLESMTLSADQERGWNVYSKGSGMVKPGTRARNEALKLMADETGGMTILETNNLEPGLQKIEEDMSYYYSLGYEAPPREESHYSAIQVKLVGVDEKYQVRLRQGYVRLSQEDKIRESVLSRLFLGSTYNPMNISVQVMPIESTPDPDQLRLTLKLLIPIKNIALLPGENDHRGEIGVYIALKDSEGNISPCRELSQEIIIPNSDQALALKSHYPYFAEMVVAPGVYTISLAVRDVLGDTLNYIQLEREIGRK